MCLITIKSDGRALRDKQDLTTERVPSFSGEQLLTIKTKNNRFRKCLLISAITRENHFPCPESDLEPFPAAFGRFPLRRIGTHAGGPRKRPVVCRRSRTSLRRKIDRAARRTERGMNRFRREKRDSRGKIDVRPKRVRTSGSLIFRQKESIFRAKYRRRIRNGLSCGFARQGDGHGTPLPGRRASPSESISKAVKSKEGRRLRFAAKSFRSVKGEISY